MVDKKYFIQQAIKNSLGENDDFVAVDFATNLKQANKQFNYYKTIGDTQQHHRFYQITQIIKVLRDEETDEAEEEIMREETWEFIGMKGKRVY